MFRWSSLLHQWRFQIWSFIWFAPLLLAIYGISSGFHPSDALLRTAAYVAAPFGLLLALTVPRKADRPPLRFGQVVLLLLAGPPMIYGLAFFIATYGAGILFHQLAGQPETQRFSVLSKSDERWKWRPRCKLSVRLEHRDTGEDLSPCVSLEFWNRVAVKQDLLLVVDASWAGSRALREAEPTDAASPTAR